MFNYRKNEDRTEVEGLVLHYRSQVAKTRRRFDAKEITRVEALRTYSRAYSSMAMVCDISMRHIMAASELTLPATFTIRGKDGRDYQSGLLVDAHNVMHSPIPLGGATKHTDIAKGDEIAAITHFEQLNKGLLKVANLSKSRFRIVAHHPALMKRMTAFIGSKGAVRRTFTLSIDNDMAVSDHIINIRRPWACVPKSKMTRAEIMQRSAKVSDKARMLSERLVEQGCYTDEVVLNALYVLYYQASQTRKWAGDLIRAIYRDIQKELSKYKGFSGWGQDVRQEEAITFAIGKGVTAMSGAPIVSFKSAENAEMPLIVAGVGNLLASVEVQDFRFDTVTVAIPAEVHGINWDAHQRVYEKLLDPMMKAYEALKAEKRYMQAQVL